MTSIKMSKRKLPFPSYPARPRPHHNKIFRSIYPAFRTAPVQLNDAAAVPVAFALYGDAMILSPSSSSEMAVVKLIRSSSLICKVSSPAAGGEKGERENASTQIAN